MELLQEVVIIVITAIFSGAGSFFFARSKYQQEVNGVKLENESKEIENLKKAIDLYNQMIDDLRKEVQILREKIQILEARK